MYRFVSAVAEALLALVFVGLIQSAIARDSVNPALYDFRVVYCGEKAIAHRLDPYVVEPLRGCERATATQDADPAWTVVPYPLPGYAGAALLPFSFVPFKVAKIAWMLSLFLAFGVAAAAIARIVRRRSWMVAAIFAPTVGFLNFIYGEPVVFAIAAVCLAALAYERDRPRLAALAASAAMIEPTIGIPACFALALLVPKARLVIAACGALAVGLSFATLGVERSIEYVTVFLPLHAHSEVYATDQYSLTRLLFLAGVEPEYAIHAGVLAYFAVIIVGVLASLRTAAFGLPRALLVLLPVAAAMLGGSFVHDVEIAAALPAAVVLAQRSVLARLSVSLLAVQWGMGWRGLTGILTAAYAGLVSVVFPKATIQRRAAYVAGTVGAVLFLNVILAVPLESRILTGAPPIAITDTMPASIPWEWALRLSPAAGNPSMRAVAQKIPTWIALAIVPLSLFELQLGLVLAKRRRIVPESADARVATTG